MLIDPVTLVVALIIASTPVLLAAIGELVVEKTGVLNLGVEGMMIVGAVTGFIVAVETGSVTLAYLAGMAGGMVLSALFAILTQVLLSNQVATGLALTLFGIGLAALLGVGYPGSTPPRVPDIFPQALQDIPIAGPILFGHSAMIYLAVMLVATVWYVLQHTRTGLILRAVGESHDAAHALGYKVIRIRILAILFRRRLRGAGRGVPVGRPRAELDRGNDGRRRVDRAGARRLRLMETVACALRCLSLRRHLGAAVAPPGGGGERSRRAAGQLALCRDDHRSRPDLVGPRPRRIECARLPWQGVPCQRIGGAHVASGHHRGARWNASDHRAEDRSRHFTG